MVGRLFGTNGIRAVAGSAFTPELALDLGRALGEFFGGTLLLARDGRRGAPMVAHALVAGITSVGEDVILTGLMPTPSLQYAARHHGMPGLMVTASHNPPEYIGVKVVDADGVELAESKERVVEEILLSRGFRTADWGNLGRVMNQEGDLQRYLDGIRAQVDARAIEGRGLRVVVDPGHGVGLLASPPLLEALGCDVKVINGTLDGNFPGRGPEPTPQSLQGLREAVVAEGADLGIAHDGDADRCIFVDEKGEIHWGDQSFGVIANWFLSGHPGVPVVTPVSSSQVVARIAERYGSPLHWTRVGCIFVSRTMMEVGSPLGGEENGGIFYGPHQPVRDGAVAAALMVHILSARSASAAKLFAEIPQFAQWKDKVPCPPEIRSAVMDTLARDAEGSRVERIDGLKIWEAADRWVLVRPSGTEPVLRIFGEASKEDSVKIMIEGYKARVMALLEDLSIAA